MTKDELRTGMIVERRDGELMLVLRDAEIYCRVEKEDVLVKKNRALRTERL